MTRRAVRSGFYCPGCGALYASLMNGPQNCGRCGNLGLRGYWKRLPKRVRCPEPNCEWKGWDDGVNDDLGRHKRAHEGTP